MHDTRLFKVLYYNISKKLWHYWKPDSEESQTLPLKQKLMVHTGSRRAAQATLKSAVALPPHSPPPDTIHVNTNNTWTEFNPNNWKIKKITRRIEEAQKCSANNYFENRLIRSPAEQVVKHNRWRPRDLHVGERGKGRYYQRLEERKRCPCRLCWWSSSPPRSSVPPLFFKEP